MSGTGVKDQILEQKKMFLMFFITLGITRVLGFMFQEPETDIYAHTRYFTIIN